MHLTDLVIKSLKPKEKRYKIFDARGLHIEVQPSGTKVWRIRYFFQKKEKRATIGQYPQMSLREARASHAKSLELLDDGIDPFDSLGNTSNSNRVTFAEVAYDWVDKQAPRWSDIHKGTVKTRLERYALPHIGDLPIESITPPDVLRFVRLIEGKGAFETASRVFGICSQVFRFAVACGICPSDPCRDLRGALTTHVETPRPAITDPDEVGALLLSIRDYRGAFVTRMAMLWSAYTFCRPGEVRKAEWSEIVWDKQEWRIPAEKMKMRFEHRVPLSTQCMKILEDLRERKLSEQWIFPGVRPGRPLSENGVLCALRRMGYEKHEMTAHGFRAMASTLLNELGYRPDIIERQLAHGDTDKVRAIYNRAAYLDERRAMMQAWSNYLDSLVKKKRNHPV